MMRRAGKTRQLVTSESQEFSGLRFAVYARKSTDDARHEDRKSVARQIAQVRAYVEARGGEVLADHLHQDDAVSRAEFKHRAGLLRLIEALKNGKPFNAVVMSEESRLGREQVETAYILKQITDAGVRVFCYMDDREAKLDSAMDKITAQPDPLRRGAGTGEGEPRTQDRANGGRYRRRPRSGRLGPGDRQG